MTSGSLSLRLAWPLYLGMTVAGAAAVVASAATLAALARTAGWSSWTPWLLPAAVDVGGSVGGWVWLRPGAPGRARRFGRVVALAGAGASLVGNGAGHLISTGYLNPGPVLVVVVGAIPAAVLVALAHLSAVLATPADGGTTPDDGHVTVTVAPSPHTAGPPTPTPMPQLPSALLPVAEPATTASSPAPSPTPDDGSDTRAAVLAEVQRRPVTVADLVTVTGRSRTTVVGHLTALTGDGVITRDPDKRYRPVTRPHVVQEPAS